MDGRIVGVREEREKDKGVRWKKGEGGGVDGRRVEVREEREGERDKVVLEEHEDGYVGGRRCQGS